MYIISNIKYFQLLRNRLEWLGKLSLLYLVLKDVQINYIFYENIYIHM